MEVEVVPELKAALEIAIETGARYRYQELFDELAAVAVKRGQAESAARLLGAADRLREEMIAPVSDPSDVERTFGMLRADLGAPAFDREVAEGRSAYDEEILALARTIE